MTVLRGDQVVLRPVEAGDAEPLRAALRSPEVRAWWGACPDDFPADDPEAVRFTILAGGELAGLIQYSEESEPESRHAGIDIFVGPDHHGRGVGTDAVRTLVRHLMDDRGHHRVTIDPAAENAAAVRCYEKAGFRRVGIHEKAWRDADGVWRDVQFMEIVRTPA